MLTKKAKYSLIALIHLSRSRSKGPILISEMAQDEHIPKKFLELILLELKNYGILQSKKGKGGGYFLARPPELIRVGQVIRMMDGPLAPIPCVSETAYEKCDDCTDELNCPIRSVMKQVRDAMAGILDNMTLAELSKTPRHKLRALK